MKKSNKYIKDCFVIILLCVVLFFMLFPFIWMLSTSFKPVNEIFSKKPQIIPQEITFASYRKLIKTTNFPTFFLNSSIIVSSAVLFTILFSSMAAYAFSRYKFHFRDGCLVGILFSQFFPWIVLVTPVYIFFRKLGLTNTYPGLIFCYTAVTLPISIFMLIGYFESIPKAIDDAARVDGCSEIKIVFKIILPLSWPGLIAVATYAFIMGWNEFVFGVTLMTKTKMKTVPVGLASLFGEYGVDWDILMSASTIATVPALALFLFLGKYLVQGITAGAIKG